VESWRGTVETSRSVALGFYCLAVGLHSWGARCQAPVLDLPFATDLGYKGGHADVVGEADGIVLDEALTSCLGE
jgi:hypothetical protein